ncbi:MAG: SDR family oxidoreductase [Acidobacteriia bacterium]|nr:SDR family oxidoreductase [Terriglobia bacterium]
MPQALQGKTTIVTGASRGIGRSIAVRLAAAGSSVVLCARDQALLDAAAAEIRSAGGIAETVALDLRAPDSGKRVVDFTISRFGLLDIVVNNAGATKRGDFLDLTDEDFADGFALKFFGSVRLTRAAWPYLKAAGGSVVFISGVGGRTPGAQFTIGGSVNAALLSLTKALADLGLRDGVQVNCVNPGTIRTARYTARLNALAKERGLDPESAEREYVKNAAIARIGEPEDIAALVEFITAPGGRMLHGALIDMDAGATKTI